MISPRLSLALVGALTLVKVSTMRELARDPGLSADSQQIEKVESKPEEKAEILSLARWQPNYGLLQHSSYVGLAAAGIGYGERDSYFTFELIYGFTSRHFSGHNVSTLSGKTTWRISNFNISPQWTLTPLLGLNIIYNPDPELFVRLPDQYPDWYYPPSAIRPAFVFGAEVAGKLSWRASIEYSLLDTELPYIFNTKNPKLDQVGSLGFVLRKEIQP